MPVQRLSVEAHREQEGKQGKTLTTLGSYWKGRKPLILNRACVLGCLLPATGNLAADLEVFELLLGIDDASLATRLGLPSAAELPAASYRQLVARARRPEELTAAETARWSSSRCQAAGSAYMKALVRACSFDGPPSIR